MTNTSENLPSAGLTLNAILIRRGELGGYFMEVDFSGKPRQFAGFSTMEEGQQLLSTLLGAFVPAAKEVKKTSKAKEPAAKEPATVAAEPVVKKGRGWPKGKPRKAKVNGAAEAYAQAA